MKFRLFPARLVRPEAQQATFEAQLEPCWEALWRYAYRTTGNTDEAEDLLSETLMEGYRSFPQFRGETPFVRWMYRIMTTTRIDMVRRNARHRAERLDNWHSGTERDSMGAKTAITRDIPDEQANPEQIVVGPMLSEHVQQALTMLSEEYRQVVILADMEQMDYTEVSSILGVPIGTVRSRLHRARGQLRKYLGNEIDHCQEKQVSSDEARKKSDEARKKR